MRLQSRQTQITGSGQGKKTFFINCGIHAREWVTQATCMYMIKQVGDNIVLSRVFCEVATNIRAKRVRICE